MGKEAFLNITPSSTLAYSSGSGNLYEFQKDSGVEPKYSTQTIKDYKVIPWGAKNTLPFDHLEIIFGNENKPQIISNRISLAIGKGIFAFRKQISDDGKETIIPVNDQPEITNFLKTCNPFTLGSYNDFMEEALFDDEAFANPFASIMLNKAGTKVSSIKSLDASTCRIGVHKETGERACIIGDWKNKQAKEDSFKILPFWNPSEPRKYFESVLHLNQKVSGQPFYTLVTWNGTKTWAEISKLIPLFHLSGLKNGSYIRYHIKIPANYLDKFPSDDRAKEKQNLQDEIDKWLAGADNNHKNFTSFVEMFGGVPTEWKIERVEGDLKDDSYLTLDEHADTKQSRGHDIHPVLSNIQTAGKLSAGSEILNLLNFHVGYKTPRPRERMCFPLKVIGLINGWPDDVEFGFKDVQFTTTDKNPTGKQEAITE